MGVRKKFIAIFVQIQNVKLMSSSSGIRDKILWKYSPGTKNNQNIYDENSSKNIEMLEPRADISILLNVQ